MLKSNCILILNLFHVCYFNIDLGMSSLSNKREPFFQVQLSNWRPSKASETFFFLCVYSLEF